MSSAVSKKSQENMNQKLALVIKSGKYKLGKRRYTDLNFFSLCYKV
jgi:ribosomal protein L30E